jgi:2-amino-4-hydroxy-6-hydroxymethyldihydropteridine diphosphokinase
MELIYIAAGSNLGDRRYYIETAVKKIRQLPNTKVKKVSRLIQTSPEGGPGGQGPYLNGVIEVESELFPYDLLLRLQRIEAELGRVRTVADAPRTIDLDIVMYGRMRIDERALSVPHPRALKREFVMLPLTEIAPGAAKALKTLSAGGKKEKARSVKRRMSVRRKAPSRMRKRKKA